MHLRASLLRREGVATKRADFSSGRRLVRDPKKALARPGGAAPPTSIRVPGRPRDDGRWQEGVGRKVTTCGQARAVARLSNRDVRCSIEDRLEHLFLQCKVPGLLFQLKRSPRSVTMFACRCASSRAVEEVAPCGAWSTLFGDG